MQVGVSLDRLVHLLPLRIVNVCLHSSALCLSQLRNIRLPSVNNVTTTPDSYQVTTHKKNSDEYKMKNGKIESWADQAHCLTALHLACNVVCWGR